MTISSINSNIPAGYAAQNLRGGIDAARTAAIRTSSGNQITKAADDASGLAIGTGLKIDVATLRAALKGASQATSILSISDGILSNISELLGRLRSLSVTANSGAMAATQLTYIQDEVGALVSEVTRVADNTQFNGATIFDGTYTNKLFQVGLEATDTISVSFATAMDATGLAINTIDVTVSATTAITALDTAIGVVKGERALVGALQSRFGYASANMETMIQNTDSARADYLDADMADASTLFANSIVKIQASVAVLAQVNQLPSNLLKLLG
ncbi:MAG: flagellin [Gammaproteobacteria bacterium]